jgi:hypothetical protein
VNRFARGFLGCIVVLTSLHVQAFQVLPEISNVDSKLTTVGANRSVDWLGQLAIKHAIPIFKNPVHEAITLKALGCNSVAGAEKSCLTLAAVQSNQFLLYGVRWPDDPPFRLDANHPPRISHCNPSITLRSTSQPKCWLGLFNDADRKAQESLKKNPGQAAFGPGHYLLYRSHFGDLQFMHAMAVHHGERAGDTAKRMTQWARFLWGIAVSELETGRYIRTLDVEGLAPYFPGDITASNLFATGIIEARAHLDEVALGALLHMVQDSFSQAHAGRGLEPGAPCISMRRFDQPGKITKFYSYAGQVGSLHDAQDTFDALARHTLQVQPGAVDATRALLTLWREQAPWPVVAPYIECLFAVEDPEIGADAGPFTAPVRAPAPLPGPSIFYELP